MRFFWFGRGNGRRRKQSRQPKSQAAPGTEIRYDERLIARFTGHHRVLVDLAGKTRASAESNDFAQVTASIRKFKLMLNEHLLEENLRLYTYLSYCLKGDAEGSELMDEMRREMAGIGRKVSLFLRHYEEHGVDARNVAKFIAEFDQVVEALGDRIEREERSLYTMYVPPSQIRAVA